MPGAVQTYVDVQGDKSGMDNSFMVTVTAPGPFIIGVQHYNPRMEPSSCYNETMSIYGLLNMDGQLISYIEMVDLELYSYLEFNYLKPGQYVFKVVSDYGMNAVPDFTVKAFSTGNVQIAKMNATAAAAFNMLSMKLAIANGGMFTNYGDSEIEPYFEAYNAIGFGFTYFEVNAGSMAINLTFTIYTSGATAIVTSNNTKCGNVSNSTNYGTYFQCVCALPAFNPMPLGGMGSAPSGSGPQGGQQGGQPPQGGQQGGNGQPPQGGQGGPSSSMMPQPQMPPTCAYAYNSYEFRYSFAWN